MDRLAGSRLTPYLFAAPVALYLLLFQGWPLVQEVLLSFTSTSLLSPQDRLPVGFENYQDLASQPDFLAALGITFCQLPYSIHRILGEGSEGLAGVDAT